MWHDHTLVKVGNKKSKAIKRAEGGGGGQNLKNDWGLSNIGRVFIK